MPPGRLKTALANRELPPNRAGSAVAVIVVAALATSIGLVLSSGGGTADAAGQPSTAPPARPTVAPARPTVAPAAARRRARPAGGPAAA